MAQTNPLRAGLRIARTPEPCTMVIFGATGDLTNRKLLPALYNLMREGMFPAGFSMIGMGRKAASDTDFRTAMRQSAEQFSRVLPLNDEVWSAFEQSLFWVSGEFTDPQTYATLAQRLNDIDQARGSQGNHLFYLAIPPSIFDDVITQLQQAGLNKREHGWTRIIIEKPFGQDLASAQELNAIVSRAFDETQVYRIDHYLGKETVQNLLVMRFANAIFEPIWNRNYIDHVQITVAEDLGIGTRAGYYEESGALRDMVTNHMMQLLTLTAMEPPVLFEANAVRSEKVKVLRAIHHIMGEDVDRTTVRAQYSAGNINGEDVVGYLQEQGVNPESRTPTYVALKFEIENWRWAGVPFYLRTGKRLAKRVTEIAIHFKKPPMLLFEDLRDDIEQNILALRIQPNEGISLKLSVKRPGQSMTIQPVNMDFRYGSSFGVAAPEAYERLLLDAMLGDPTLFTRRDEVEEQWSLMTPILERWAQTNADPLPQYEAGTWGPDEAETFMHDDGREWRKL